MQRPNILLIMTDEHCGHAMSCAGNPYVKTPALDQLANQGVRFNHAYVTQPLCVPFRTALQMGCWPHQTKVMVNAQRTVPEDAPMHPMVGKLMHEAGYRCGYAGKMHIATSNADGSRSINLSPDDLDLHGYRPCIECDDQDIPGIAEDFLNTQDDRPFFLTASFLNPHDCMVIGKDLNAQEDRIGPMPTSLDDLPPLPTNHAIPENEPSVVRQHWERYAVPYGNGTYVPYPTKGWDELHWRQYIWGYYRLIELVDSQIGQVLASLERSGKADNTVVIFTADHGDGAGHHGWNQKQVLYDESVRVPFLVSAPDTAQPGSVDEEDLVSAIDIIPTILDYASVDRPAHVEGQSMRPLLETGTWEAHDYVVSETLFGTGVDIVGWAGRMVRTNDYKYTVYNHGDIREQLTDMRKDPGEMHNLAMDPAFATVLREHRDMLVEWCEQTGDAFLTTPPAPAPVRDIGRSPERGRSAG